MFRIIFQSHCAISSNSLIPKVNKKINMSILICLTKIDDLYKHFLVYAELFICICYFLYTVKKWNTQSVKKMFTSNNADSLSISIRAWSNCFWHCLCFVISKFNLCLADLLSNNNFRFKIDTCSSALVSFNFKSSICSTNFSLSSNRLSL